MANPDHDNWLGYLVSVFIDETVAYSRECCPGCVDEKNSPLLHTHHHFGLLEKLYMFHPLIKEAMLSKMWAPGQSGHPSPKLREVPTENSRD